MSPGTSSRELQLLKLDVSPRITMSSLSSYEIRISVFCSPRSACDNTDDDVQEHSALPSKSLQHSKPRLPKRQKICSLTKRFPVAVLRSLGETISY